MSIERNKISCRETVFESLEAAVISLPKAGVNFIELQIRELEELEKANELVRKNGITPLTLSGGVDCDDPEQVKIVSQACSNAAAIGVNYIFLSTKGENYEHAVEVLQNIGLRAETHEVTICLETHPPFCLNAENMLKTVNDVNHENIRINFDTANIFYYNENMDSADELTKVINYVGSVHLKDTDGGFKSGNFPVFGEGVVKFPQIFRSLHSANFSGPLTMELEGSMMTGLDTAGRTEKVIKCVEYLASIGEA